MLRNTFRLSIAFILTAALLVSASAEARNSGPRLRPSAYAKQRKLYKARGNRQYKLYQRGGKHAAKHKAHAVKNHKRAKISTLKHKAAKALQRGDKAAADKLWTQAKQLEAALNGKAPAAAVTAQPTKASGKAGKAKADGRSYNQARKSYQSSIALYKQQRAEAKSSGDASLLRESQVNRVAASKAMHSMIKSQESGLRLKAARTSDPAKKASFLAKADKLNTRAQRLDAAIKSYESKIPKAKQVADAEQPRPGATAKAGTYRQMKRFVAVKDLSSALSTLKSMEKAAAKATGIKGIWKKFQVGRARRALRKAAVAVGTEAIRTGGAAGDQQLLEQRREYAKQVRELRSAGLTPEQRQALRAEIAQVPNLRQHGSNYTRARSVLRHLNRKGRKYEKRPVRRVITALGNLVFGSVRASNAKLDRALIKEARYLSSKGPDGAAQARILLSSAAARGKSKTIRFRLAHRKARKALTKVIRQAIKDGDPNGVEQAQQLREAYIMDRKGPDYRLSDRAINKMNKQIERADMNMVSKLAKQAAWIAKYPRQAEQLFRYGPDAAATINNLARETASRLIQNGRRVPSSVVRMMNKTDGKLNRRKPGIIRRIATLPLKVALIPFKVLHWATVNQARHFIYNKTGGAPPPPMKPERLNQLMQSSMPRQENMEGSYGQGQGGAPMTPADAMM